MQKPQEPLENLPQYHRIAVKVGTNVLTAGTDRLDLEVMAALVSQIARLHGQGREITLVSSGAIAAGRHLLGLTVSSENITPGRQLLGISKEPRDIPFRQVLAAVGQSRLMDAYDQLFTWHGITVAQALLTRKDLADRLSYLNARNTLLALMELRVVPIINENDVVAGEEATFGDNDALSALVATMVDADLLVILTDIAGLYTADPQRDPQAQLLRRVEAVDDAILALAADTIGERGTGGMATKVRAARMATAAGIAVVIADGRERDTLGRIAAGESLGTFFAPATTKLEGRKRWMLSGLSLRGTIFVDDGAATALLEKNRSLLPPGIVRVEGDFQRGDIVTIADPSGKPLAYGITNYNAEEVAQVRGRRSTEIEGILGYQFGAEVVHRNNMVLV